jgi:hypothetical protein
MGFLLLHAAATIACIVGIRVTHKSEPRNKMINFMAFMATLNATMFIFQLVKMS